MNTNNYQGNMVHSLHGLQTAYQDELPLGGVYSHSNIQNREKLPKDDYVQDPPKTPELQYLSSLAQTPSTIPNLVDDTETPATSSDIQNQDHYEGLALTEPLHHDELGLALTINQETASLYDSTVDIDSILDFYLSDSETEDAPLLSSPNIDGVEVGLARIEIITTIEETSNISKLYLSPASSYSPSEPPPDSDDAIYFTIHRDVDTSSPIRHTYPSPIADLSISRRSISDSELDFSYHDVSTRSRTVMQTSMLDWYVKNEHLVKPVNCSYHYTIENIFTKAATGNIHKISSRTNHKCSLEVLIETTPMPSSSSTGDYHKVAIILRAPGYNSDSFQSPYLQDEDDREYAKSVNDALCTTFTGMPLKQLLGKLRFSTEIILGTHNDWMNVTMYVYERVILFISGGKLYSTINLSDDVEKVISDREDPRYIYIYSKSATSSPISLYVPKRAISHMLIELLKNPALEFPLNRDTFNKYWISMEQQMINGIFHNPRKIKSLFFVPYRLFKSSHGLAVIQYKVRHIESTEELAIIVYSGDGIHYNGNFQGKLWGGWKSLVNREFARRYQDYHELHNYKDNGLKKSMHNRVVSDSSLNSSTDDTNANENTPTGRRLRMDELIIMAGKKLESYNPETEIANVVLIADKSLIPQQGEPKELVSEGINITAIGISETHDAMSLLRLVAYTGGTYNYARSYQELSEIITRCHRVVKHGALHDVKVKIRLRLQTELESFSYAGMLGRDKPKLLSSEDRLYEWNIGSLGIGDVRTMIVNVKGKLPIAQPIMRLNFEFNNHLENNCEKMNATINVMHTNTRSLQDDKRNWLTSIMYLEELIVDVCRGLEKAIWFYIYEEPFKAASILQQSLVKLIKSREEQTEKIIPEIANIIDGFERMFRLHRMSAIASNMINRRAVLMIIRNLWVLYQRRSFCGAEEIDIIFR